MKILDVLIGIVVLAIVGTIGYGVYYAVINPETLEPTDPPIIAKGRSVDYSSEVCPISLKHPNTWGADEEDGGKVVTLLNQDYKILITCDAEDVTSDVTAKAYRIDNVTIDEKDFVRYVFFSDEETIQVSGGYVVPDDKNLAEDAEVGYKYTGSLVIDAGDGKYSIKYEFPEGARATNDEGSAIFDGFVDEMDAIVESLIFE